MKYMVLFGFVLIFSSLAAALFFMMKNTTDNQKGGKKMARALMLRIGFSILLFLAILIGWKLGYLHPTGIPTGA
ncbi:DUF2909 domain-containing protein [Rhodoferax sp. PAMC 29310]|uniref:DUF2909 domain-containing protein n=1 Tax=Rhodoferax sp. PAMC 29310 TaxID=2822760 RepID=UPI001B322F10|nr:DUF2909 domain-containing protein [Rhodoferax sp. PAMC 29310]